MSSTPVVSWDDLNERQRTYLLAIYQCDQAEEKFQRSAWTPGSRTRPAEEWRWLFYGEYDYGPSPLKRTLLNTGVVDQGTGSTFEALQSRGLVLLRSSRGLYRGYPHIVYVRVTTAGRKLVRQSTGEVRGKKLPVGALWEWHWRALAQMYRAGALKNDHFGGNYFAIDDERQDSQDRTTWETLRHLLEYKWGALCREACEGYEWRYELTPFGRAYYEQEWAFYRKLYPDVDALEPSR
jgi:hypothetical protein